MRWHIIWHMHEAQNEATFLWSIIHKVVALNKCRVQISREIDNSFLHCGPQFVESVEHRFFSCLLAQQVCRYAVNIIWQLFAKKATLALDNPFQCYNALLIDRLAKHWSPSIVAGFSRGIVFRGSFGINVMIWLSLLFNVLWRKHTKLYGILCSTMVHLSGNVPFKTWTKLHTLLTMMCIENFTRFWCVKELVTHIILVVTWRFSP